MSLFANLPFNSQPYGLAFDGSGNLYVAEEQADQINKITPGGVVSLFATLPSGSFAHGLAIDGTGNFYAAAFGTGQINKITADGLTVTTFATGINNPTFIVFVPEPASAALLAASGLCLLGVRRQKRK